MATVCTSRASRAIPDPIPSTRHRATPRAPAPPTKCPGTPCAAHAPVTGGQTKNGKLMVDGTGRGVFCPAETSVAIDLDPEFPLYLDGLRVTEVVTTLQLPPWTRRARSSIS